MIGRALVNATAKKVGLSKRTSATRRPIETTQTNPWCASCLQQSSDHSSPAQKAYALLQSICILMWRQDLPQVTIVTVCNVQVCMLGLNIRQRMCNRCFLLDLHILLCGTGAYKCQLHACSAVLHFVGGADQNSLSENAVAFFHQPKPTLFSGCRNRNLKQARTPAAHNGGLSNPKVFNTPSPTCTQNAPIEYGLKHAVRICCGCHLRAEPGPAARFGRALRPAFTRIRHG